MYEELVKRLRECTAEQNGEKTLWHQAADVIEELQEDNAALNGTVSNLIRQIAELSKPKWIPARERLPDGDSQILVCYKLRDGQYWQRVCRFANNLHEVDKYDFPKERRPGFCYYDDEYGWIEKTGVTHWMPLPEPPTEE